MTRRIRLLEDVHEPDGPAWQSGVYYSDEIEGAERVDDWLARGIAVDISTIEAAEPAAAESEDEEATVEESADGDAFDTMSLIELKEYAAKHDIDIAGMRSKEEIKAAIRSQAG